jgi:hypothetical protein
MSRAVSLNEAWRVIGKGSPGGIIRAAAKVAHALQIIAATARQLRQKIEFLDRILEAKDCD